MSDYDSDTDSDFSETDDLPLADLIRTFSTSSSTSSSSDDDDDDDEPAVQPVREWTNRFTTPKVEAFNEEPGPNLPDGFDTLTATPLDYFWMLFPMELVLLMVRFTNAYAAWKFAQPGASPNDAWTEVTEPEMRAFLALNILMGINDLPQLEMYWSKDPFLQNAGVTQTMTCNRFQGIIRYFHVADRAAEPARGQPNYDPLFKIQPIIQHLSRTFRACYTLSREVSIDEGMIAFTGRLSFRQYMPAKPVKRGVKVWLMADAVTAYLARFEFYLGRQETGREHGLGYNVEMKLSDYLRNTHRHIYFDNYFTGVELMEDLLQRGLYACGTVRPMRKGFPKQLKKPADIRNRGAFRILQKGDSNLTASVWMDRNHVHHLSTLSDPTEQVLAQRRVGRDFVEVPIPSSVSAYNKFMGGVDLHDQHRSSYSIGRKGKNAWRYMFWFLFNAAVINAFIIYKSVSRRATKKRRFTHLDFRMDLMRQLIGGYSNRKRVNIEAGYFAGIVDTENIEGHVNSRMPGKGKRCKLHLKENVRRETVYGNQTNKQTMGWWVGRAMVRAPPRGVAWM